MEQAVQQLFDNAQRIVFLTGAGVSTASGIPDFRSANGLYTKDRNAEYYLSHRSRRLLSVLQGKFVFP